MSESEASNLAAYLEGGRRLLERAPQEYGRALAPEEFWWLGVGLAASTLAELGGQSYAVGRIEQLVDRLGHKGVRGDWLQRFVEELANLNAEGLLWPLYERSEAGAMEPTGLAVHPGFDAQTAYFLALGHLGVALAVHNGDEALVGQLAGAIADLVETGRSGEVEALILGALRLPEEDA